MGGRDCILKLISNLLLIVHTDGAMMYFNTCAYYAVFMSV